VPFKYTGDVPLLYTQYRDLESDRPLFAQPGQSYDMAPVGSWDLTVPPSDGRWDPPPAPPGPPDEGQPDESEPGGEGGLPPLPLISGTGTEGEEN
jgi:hypothetical protein